MYEFSLLFARDWREFAFVDVYLCIVRYVCICTCTYYICVYWFCMLGFYVLATYKSFHASLRCGDPVSTRVVCLMFLSPGNIQGHTRTVTDL